MANPMKKSLSKNLSEMKFMKRHSQGSLGKDETDFGGVLTEKWVVPGAPPPAPRSEKVKDFDSFMECERLSRFGRFSFNKFNKDVERMAGHYARAPEGIHDPDDIEDETEAIPAHEVARRYEEITSKKLLGKRKRSDIFERRLSEPPRIHPGSGFLKPS